MKVINTWDGEPARTPTKIIRDWYAEYKDEMHWGGIDGFHATELMAALASRKDQEMNSRCADCNCEDCRCDRPPMPAANQWRYDVKNAQFTEDREYLIEYTHPWYPTEPAANYRGTVFYVAEHDHFTHPCHGIITRDRLRAFATINRPETTHDNP